MMSRIIRQGLPTGIQNSVIGLGNVVIQSNVNSFGAYAMSGLGAYSKVEGFAFLPVTAMSMTLPTFVSQNLGAGNVDRAKKGSCSASCLPWLRQSLSALSCTFSFPNC